MNTFLRGTLAFLVAAALGLSQVGCGTRTPAEHVAEAKNLIAKGELNSASIELTNALQQDANSLEARWLLGQVSLDLGDGARAEKEIRRAIELGYAPGSAQLSLVKSIALQGELQRVLAETHLIEDGASTADHAAILGIRAQAYAERREFEEASDTLDEALELDAKSVPALVGKALMHALQRDYDGAREWVGKALEVDASSPESWSLLGQIELEQGKAEEAETAFSKAIEKRAYSGLELAKRALARVQLGKFAEADADIAILKIAGLAENAYVNYVAGVSYFAQGKYAEAAGAFETSKLAMVEPYLPREYYLAATYLNLGRFEQARAQAELVSGMAPRSPAAKRLLGSVQVSQSELGAATQVLTKAVVDSPDDVALLRMLGHVELLVGNAAQAVEHYERVLVLEPDSAQATEALAIAKLMSGQDLDMGRASNLGEAVTATDGLTRELLTALAAFRDGDITDALKQAQSLHSKYPDSVEPLKLIAACYLGTSQWSTAKTYLEQILKINPNEPSAAKNLAKLEVQEGNPGAAHELLAALVEQVPHDEEAVLSLARVELLLNGEESALRVLEQASERAPEALKVRSELARFYGRSGLPAKVLELTRNLNATQFKQAPVLLELRGRALMDEGDIASAQLSFKQLTDFMPDSAPAQFLYAESLALSGDMDHASQALKRAIELNAEYLPARVGEIKMLVNNGEVAKAKERLPALRAEFGGRPEVLGIEGWFALGTGDFVTAADRFSSLLENQQDSEIMVLYVRSLWGQKKYDEAIERMQRWLQEQPKDLGVAMHLAGGYLALNREDEARAAYAKVVENYPRHVPALNNLAWLTRNGDITQAVAYAKQAEQLSPNDPAVMDTLGMLLTMQGDKVRGQRLIQNAAERAPDDLDIQVHLAQVLVDQGRVEEAKQVLRKVIEKAGNGHAAASARSALELLP
jgi:putative PEP-CTERM system TPR-repeat lipoprotein